MRIRKIGIKRESRKDRYKERIRKIGIKRE